MKGVRKEKSERVVPSALRSSLNLRYTVFTCSKCSAKERTGLSWIYLT